MSIPDYQSLMLPVLKYASDGEDHKFSDVVEELADELGLTAEERRELLPSGTQAVFRNRVGWAKSYLKQAGLVGTPKRGYFTITERGKQLLASNVDGINVRMLEQYPEFLEFKNRRKCKKENRAVCDSSSDLDSTQTPEDVLATAYDQLRNALENELLSTIKEASPSFFERLVVDLLVGMGYGGNRRDAGKALGKSGDEGIDGIINEDKLGLDVIYIQAKRWENVVGRPEIQKFAGALQGKRSKKGVFITTSSFTKAAEEYASLIDTRIILIDGERLAGLMVDYNVGVSTIGKYEVKKIDSDYFDDE